jgi:hypothetical protein
LVEIVLVLLIGLKVIDLIYFLVPLVLSLERLSGVALRTEKLLMADIIDSYLRT